MDEQRLAGLQIGSPGERPVGGAVGDREAGRVDEIQPVRDREGGGAFRDDFFREAPVPGDGHDAHAGNKAFDLGPAFHDRARDLEAGRERKWVLFLVLAGDHQEIGEIDAGRVHPDPDPGREKGGRRCRFEGKFFRRSPFPAKNGLHLGFLGSISYDWQSCPAPAGGFSYLNRKDKERRWEGTARQGEFDP